MILHYIFPIISFEVNFAHFFTDNFFISLYLNGGCGEEDPCYTLGLIRLIVLILIWIIVMKSEEPWLCWPGFSPILRHLMHLLGFNTPYPAQFSVHFQVQNPEIVNNASPSIHAQRNGGRINLPFFPPNFHLIVSCFCHVGFSLL